jgi:RNA polymerase sigma-70 factor (ECF subfamily)
MSPRWNLYDNDEILSLLIEKISKQSEEDIITKWNNKGELWYKNWNLLVLYNLMYDHLQKRQRHDELSEHLEDETIDKDFEIDVNNLMRELHWYDKELLKLYYIDGYSLKEISQATGIGLKSISWNIRKTIKKLKTKHDK